MNNLKSILNIEFLIKDDAFKNWRMILFLSLLAVIMISSGHSADKKIFKIASLNIDIKVLKSEFIEAKKQLLLLKNLDLEETEQLDILLNKIDTIRL